MPDEKPAPMPLSGEEVRAAILFKVEESLGRTCNLRFDDAYSSFKAEISIKLTLSDFGREVRDNHNVSAHAETTLEAGEVKAVEANLTIGPAPPNQVRVETGQPVPIVVVEKGKQVVKHVKYASKKVQSGGKDA